MIPPAAPPAGRPIKLWDDTGHDHDMMSTRLLGFWLYMLSDSLIFAALFAAYGVLSYPIATAGGPGPAQVSHPVRAYVETVILFTSALTFGSAMYEVRRNRPNGVIVWTAVSFVLGAVFLGLEYSDLSTLAAGGATPQRSGFLSAFFTILTVHGIHIAFGLLWMLVMMVQTRRYGLDDKVTFRLANLKVFWLYQAVIWGLVFTFVYLWGVI